MVDPRESLWHHYRRDQYSLIAMDWSRFGATIDLVCEKMREVAFVVMRDAVPPPEEQARLNRGLCWYLRWHRATGVYVRWDRAWLEDGHWHVEQDAFPVTDPDTAMLTVDFVLPGSGGAGSSEGPNRCQA